MAAAMASCRVLGGAEGVALLPLQIQSIEGKRPGRCNARFVGGKFGSCLTIGRKRTAVVQSEFVTATLASRLSQLQYSSAARDSSHWRQNVYLKNIFTNDFCSTENAGEDAISNSALVGLLALPALAGFPGTANASVFEPNMAYGEVGAGLEFGVQLIYLGALLSLLAAGSFLVVRQVLIRRELESAAKDLQDRVRSGEASSEEFFELGAVMLRKKYYVLANKYLEQAIKKWDGDEADLAQVYNALGFSYFSDDKLDASISQYEKAVTLQPGYVTAWNNLGNAYEVKKDFQKALKAYEEALQFDPSNKIAQRQRDAMKERVTRFRGIPAKD
ncbi:tetratricopeptide repeat domain-containing protein PYG7, chloroplastic isoform X2 [Physcomitrium patens]|uniref:Uncharacterized protein n=1 Tax=Physcomitrium patens TaxID=3218 RepID=A0A7I4DAW8_PHYPA|nr:tetratricopeptide repeat domain-containing protein PYG7, chloroplastic-like isoform X2 [Physcomitrium patens]|eukprot:XP_024365879.1 tetratricopeptide repeat domain-containing protein PYG7, chloroplastic-like isoform X2 [Physcomitrella patens]